MPIDGHTAKRSAADSTTSNAKRQRTSKPGHTPDCDDTGLHRADRNVVTTLYETAISKFGAEPSIAHAQTLIQFAEYVDFGDLAEDAVRIADKCKDDKDKSEVALIRSRKAVLEVCDDAEEAAREIVGADKLAKASEDIVSALVPIKDSADSAALYNAIDILLASLVARSEVPALTRKLKLNILEIALKAADTANLWAHHADTKGKSTLGVTDTTLFTTAKAVFRWALVAAESMEETGLIEKRLEPAVQYLEARQADIDCCKLLAQVLMVLSSVTSDEDEAIGAFDRAVEALNRAHQLDPTDEDVKSQLEDLGSTDN
ncbi:hypothetical protein DL89DRAFT_263665 [Linderina pennispora]|uniref:TPR-like protein n=1 Tax=Linderina pennispora TaxID=61395 RepID=A0A1Y1WJ74_9FUNG|nr:uncharacterized protein DL89DRAFT_263665 [Linderina pennispora]ORX73631.1 hypothetical protein DL89DRAFT_263665 [Linderina pennispora]